MKSSGTARCAMKSSSARPTSAPRAAAQAASRPWLIVWPESAVPYYLSYDKQGDQMLFDTARRLQAYLAVASLGAVIQGGKTMTSNRSWLIGPRGDIIGYYDKAHLVPFGEYVP